jgi:4-hydroxy-3-methylbut-2-enyl diphosphate reductase
VGGPLLAAPLAFEAWALRRGAPHAEVVRIGMGPRKTLRSLERLRERKPGAVAVGGVCGAIDASLVPGDVVVADALLGPDGARIALDAAPLVAALARHGIEARAGAVACVAKLFGGPSRASLAALGACAVEMESFWLAPLANECAFAVLRVVSDGPGHELLRPGVVVHGARALRRLRAAAPALAEWAAAAAAP